ncbi:hypothetical protein MKW92_034724 [Papaver armeniacum]|nr:hypothetical protein MKW92_034724 [Papaver armeniacum]
MPFWGIEVEVGIPVTVRFDKAIGRLRVTRASFAGLEFSAYKGDIVAVECSVGGKPPITLCCLNTTTKYSCSLDIEFDEEDREVVFSVDGYHGWGTVHLSGYHIKESNKGN